MSELGLNAYGEPLDPGRVADCYLGLLLPPPSAGEPEAGHVLVVAPRALLDPAVAQPAGSLLYELATGHPDREPGEVVFLTDLTVELRAWPAETWAALGVDPGAVARAVIACWRTDEVQGLEFEGVSFEEAHALERPAMTIVRGQLRARLAGRVRRAYWRWLHPSSGRPGGSFLSPSPSGATRTGWIPWPRRSERGGHRGVRARGWVSIPDGTGVRCGVRMALRVSAMLFTWVPGAATGRGR